MASSVFVYTKTILRCKMLVGKSQTLELHPMDAGYAFYKTLFRHTAGMRSHHGIVMITGIGIASQQANEHSRILILRANLAFVRTKALLAEVMLILKLKASKLYKNPNPRYKDKDEICF